MKKALAILSAAAMVLAMASCGETAETSSEATSTAAPVSSAAPISVAPVSTAEPVPAGPANLALEGTAFDMNEGLSNGDEGWVDYYAREQESTMAYTLNDTDKTGGWQPAGTDDVDATLVTYDDSKAEGFYEETTEAEDGTTTTVTKYNLHEGSTNIPENWYFSSDDGVSEIREQATYEDGTVYAGIRFDETVKTDCIVLIWENDSRPLSYEENGFYLEYTVDGETWEKLDAAIAREEIEGGDATDTAEFEALEVKGVRVVVLHCINKWGTQLREMEIYEPEEVEESVEPTEDVETADETVEDAEA